MFNFRKHFFGRRVRIERHAARVEVRIARHNVRFIYYYLGALATFCFGLFCRMILAAGFRNPQNILYIAPVFLLCVTCYLIALAISAWGALGTENVILEPGTLSHTLRVLRWNRTCTVALREITYIHAITPWHGLDNTVEVAATRRKLRIGDKLLRDEAIELADHLRQAVDQFR